MAGQVTFAGTQVVVAGSTQFPLSEPTGLAVDGMGNLYIADEGNNRILMVTPTANGYSTPLVVLGNLSSPGAVASDWAGNLFVADTGNNRVLLMSAANRSTGAAITIASGLGSPSGVAVDWAENVYIADTTNHQIVELPYAAGAYGSLVTVSTGFNTPTQIAVDSKKNLYVADPAANHIVKQLWTANGFAAKQLLGVGTTTPMGVGVDAKLDMYVADTGKGRVIESTWNPGGRFNQPAVIGGGFVSPSGMVPDGNGGVYVADSTTNRVVDLVPSSVNFDSVIVGAPSVLQTFQFELNAGTSLGSVGIFTEGVAGKDFTDAGGSTCAAQTYTISTVCVVNVGFAPWGTGQRNGSIVLYDVNGNPMSTAFISGVGLEPQVAFFPGTQTYLGSGLSGPAGVTVDGSGNVFISDTGNDRVVEVPQGGAGYGPQTTVLEQGISSPMGLAIDGADNLYVVSSGNDKVVRMPWLGSAYGTPTKVGNGFYGPSNVAVDGAGNVYVADSYDSKLWKLSWTGGGFSTEQKLGEYVHFPVGVAVDSAGDVFFTSPYQNNLAMLPMVGNQYLNQVNTNLQGISFPSAIVADSNSNLYVLDTANNKVVMIPWLGTRFGAQITVATGFNAPAGIAVDMNGNLYVADTGNNQVVKIDFSSPAMLSFNSVYEGSSSAKPLTTLVANIGSQTLNLSAVTYPADFPQMPVSNSSCVSGMALAEGTSCAVSVNFTPLSANPQFLEAVTVTDNSNNIGNASQSIALTGAGTGELSQTITFPAIANVSYGSQAIALGATVSSGLPVTYQVISGPGMISHGQSLSIMGAGTIVVQATQAGNTTYQAAARVTVTFTVNPAVLTVTALNVSATYGSVPTTFNSTISGFMFGQSAGQVVSGSALIVSNAHAGSGAGSYELTVSAGSLGAKNYQFVFVPGVLTVNPAVLTISAVPVSKSYGQPMPSLAWTMSGLRNGDTASLIAGAPQITTSANTGSPVGSYALSVAQGSLAARNYVFQFASAVLTVLPATLTVSADSKVGVYGTPLPGLTYRVTGFMSGDSMGNGVQGTPTLTTLAKTGAAAGVYAVSANLGTLTSSKYKFVFTGGTITVQKAGLVVTPNSATIIYGQAMPVLTYTIAGLVNGDTQRAIAGQPVLSACALKCTTVGSYPIVASIGSLSTANYSISFGKGMLLINPALLAVNAGTYTMTYGQPVPSISLSITGFQNGETAQLLSGVASWKCGANSQSGAGSYVIAPALGTLTAKNYTFQMVNGQVKINPALLVITAGSQQVNYGSPLPVLTYSVAGLLNGDTQATAITGQPAFSTTAKQASPTGSYVITAASGSLQAKNYLLQFKPGVLTVARVALTVSANNLSMKTGSAVPTFTYAAIGLVNGDTITTATKGIPSLTTGASAKSKPGTYQIFAVKGTMQSSNYLLTLANGTLTITK